MNNLSKDMKRCWSCNRPICIRRIRGQLLLVIILLVFIIRMGKLLKEILLLIKLWLI